jgi:hypothetical protein
VQIQLLLSCFYLGLFMVTYLDVFVKNNMPPFWLALVSKRPSGKWVAVALLFSGSGGGGGCESVVMVVVCSGVT